MNKGFMHIGLNCSDIERTKQFYLSAFEGAKEVYSFGQAPKIFYMIDLGGGAILELIPFGISNPDPKSQMLHIAIDCEDIHKAFDQLVAAGATVRTPLNENNVLPGNPPCPISGAFLYGPEGELIELCQARSSNWPWKD